MDQLQRLADGTHLTVGSHSVTVVSYLSEGGFAHIYKVKIDPPADNNEIACLKRVLVKDKAGLDTLRKEVDVMKKLKSSRSIVRYYDSHAERLDSGAYHVLVLMELCPNKSLLHYMNDHIKTKLSEKQILKIMLDISIGVYEMHRKKMVHRDIKIENVLIDAHHRFKLCDFGSTCPPIPPPKNQQEFQAISHDIIYQTTPQYRAPEMIDLYRGFPIDEKADIWALGCFLYKLCYYTTPFEANGDIAILHASYQFLAAPSFSGDLKNIIVIMLQENPMLRPNIVQVIKLVATMMNVEFDTLAIEDIYGLGAYNFQALHDYQRKKQEDLMRQQQVYYQNQYMASKSQQPSAVDLPLRGQTPAEPVEETPAKAAAQSGAQSGAEPASDSDSLGDLEDQLDNIEERYPSLDNIKVEPESVDTTIKTVPEPSLKPPQPQPINNHSPQPRPRMTYPTQPVVISPAELKKLTPEQLQQYQYQHNAYQYQLSQWNYYQQQQQQQQVPYPAPSHPLDGIPANKYNNKFETKEAWETKHKKMDENAEKLVDDIFGSKSRSPGEKPERQSSEPPKASQSTKSEPASAAPNDEDVTADVVLTQSKTASSQDPKIVIDSVEDKSADTFVSTDLELADDKKLVDLGSFGAPPADKAHSKSPHLKTNPAFLSNQTSGSTPLYPSKSDERINQLDAKYAKPPFTQVKSHIDEPIISAMSGTPPKSYEPHNPGFDKSKYGNLGYNNVQRDPRYQTHRREPSGYDHANVVGSPTEPRKQLAPQEPPSLEKKKSSNPWGEYTTAPAPVPANQNLVPVGNPIPLQNYTPKSQNLLDGIQNLKVDDNYRAGRSSRKPSDEKPQEPNLINMEVGLESSSSVSTNIRTREMPPSESESLIDLDFDYERTKPSDKPVFKKRTAIPKPSDFEVREEVVDWASDDENPENGSGMNRLSIRSSLKKPKARRSGEFKRSDSSSGDGKKRLSRYLSNS